MKDSEFGTLRKSWKFWRASRAVRGFMSILLCYGRWFSWYH